MTNACGGCGHVNREGRRFCAECGQPLTTPICLVCGASNEVGEKFCGACGGPLAPSPDTAQTSPATVTVASEKKHITVLFADVAGSMDLQERLDAEEWAQIMGRFVSILAEGVRKFGGTVDKFTGDGIMALFGAPIAQEDHARRACHAAWHLTKAIADYSEELQRDHGVALHVRLGLNSGEVVVGRVGDDVRLDPTALGHTVGLAQRMEAMAEPGKTYLTAHTARLVEGWFALEHLGSFPVKGARVPLAVSVLGAPVSSPARSRVGASPLVGRERELAVLEDALAMATDGQFQVVGVVGEAGVGKSRLCDEFARSVTERGIAVRRAAGLSHGRDIPLLPVLAFQRDYFGITDADDPAAARRKVAERLLGLDPGLEDTLPLMFDFLEVPDPDRPVGQMAAEVRMRRVLDVVRRVTARRSERETLVLIFDDLHWFDSQSEAFLERLIESYPGSRTLVVANFRAGFSARWTRHSYYRQLPLTPLRDQAVTEMLGGLLGVDLSLAPLVSFVLERTSGNPFFVEEVVRALIDDGTVSGDPGHYQLTRPLDEIRVPSTVQAVLAARIDRLSGEQKAVLETASIIGRTFDRAVLSQISNLSTDILEDTLSALCAVELVQEAGGGGTEYRFWHPLTQEVAYGSLLSDRRRRLHAAVAEALEGQNGDRLDELAAVLAWHWERAGRHLEAARWNMRAGSWALRRDLPEAKRRWQATLDQLATAEETPEGLELGVRARSRLIQFGARTGIDPDDAEQIYTEARALADRLADARLLAGLVMLSGSPMFMAGDLRGASARYAEGFSLLEALPEPGPRAAVGMAVALLSAYTGPLEEGIEGAERTLRICADDVERGTEVTGYSVLVRTLQLEAWLLALAGRLGDATSRLQQALTRARPRAEAENLAWSLASSAQLAWLRGDGDDSLPSASEAVSIAEQTGDLTSLIMALDALALAHLLAGKATEAAGICERALAEARGSRCGLFQEGNLFAHLARARLGAGDPGAAVSAAEEAVAVARHQGAQVVECLALLTRAQVRPTTGESEEARQADLDAALRLVHETGALTYESFIREELGRLHDDEKEMREALRLYRQVGATGHARRLEAERSARSVR